MGKNHHRKTQSTRPHCQFDLPDCILLPLSELPDLDNNEEDVGSGIQEADTPPYFSLHLQGHLRSIQQARSIQEDQSPPANFSVGFLTMLGDSGTANFCVENLTAQDGVGRGAFSTAGLPQQHQFDLLTEKRCFPAWVQIQKNVCEDNVQNKENGHTNSILPAQLTV